jgi:hypothetical protein
MGAGRASSPDSLSSFRTAITRIPAARMFQGVTRLGYQIPNFTYPDTDPSTLFDAIVRQAVEADNSGFDTVMVMDHFYQLPGLGTLIKR